MNKEQRKYILERIGDIAKCKREALRDLDKRATQKYWNANAKAEFIITGKAKLKPHAQLLAIITKPTSAYDLQYEHVYYLSFYDYPPFEAPPKVKNLSSRLTAIQNEADKLKDVCMLGDVDELLEKLASFEKKEF